MRSSIPSAVVLLFIGAATFSAPSAADVFAARFPGATLLQEDVIEYDESTLPKANLPAKFEAGPVEMLEGRIRHTVQGMPPGRSVLEVFRAYERAAVADGFQETFSCRSVSGCGGSIPYLMNKSKRWLQISFSDEFGYSLMERTSHGAREVLALLVSTAGGSNAERAAPKVYLELVSTDAVETDVDFLSSDEIAEQITGNGSATIYGLEFALNSAELLPESDEVVEQIALYLQQYPEQRIYLVGHTDAQGSFDHNMELSKQRAAAVGATLLSDYGIAGNRLEAHGVGFLAPKASNQHAEGQARNRRVEVIPF